MLYMDRVLLTRRTVHRQFPTIKGWTTEALKERVREERKATQGAKGFGKGRVEPPIELPKDEHAQPPLQQKNQPQQQQQQNIFSETDDPSELEKDMEEVAEVTKNLAGAFKRYRTFMDYLSKKYRNNQSLKMIRDKAITMFSSYCEAHMSKSPPMAQRENADETGEIPPFSQDDEWWNSAAVLEAIIELENAFVRQQQTSSANSKASASRKCGDDMPTFKLIESQSPHAPTPTAPQSHHSPAQERHHTQSHSPPKEQEALATAPTPPPQTAPPSPASKEQPPPPPCPTPTPPHTPPPSPPSEEQPPRQSCPNAASHQTPSASPPSNEQPPPPPSPLEQPSQPLQTRTPNQPSQTPPPPPFVDTQPEEGHKIQGREEEKKEKKAGKGFTNHKFGEQNTHSSEYKLYFSEHRIQVAAQ